MRRVIGLRLRDGVGEAARWVDRAVKNVGKCVTSFLAWESSPHLGNGELESVHFALAKLTTPVTEKTSDLVRDYTGQRSHRLRG